MRNTKSVFGHNLVRTTVDKNGIPIIRYVCSTCGMKFMYTESLDGPPKRFWYCPVDSKWYRAVRYKLEKMDSCTEYTMKKALQ